MIRWKLRLFSEDSDRLKLGENLVPVRGRCNLTGDILTGSVTLMDTGLPGRHSGDVEHLALVGNPCRTTIFPVILAKSAEDIVFVTVPD